jgi:hypothetical protein
LAVVSVIIPAVTTSNIFESHVIMKEPEFPLPYKKTTAIAVVF